MSAAPADIGALRGAIGRTQQVHDVVSERLVSEFLATFDQTPEPVAAGTPAPLGIHWCLGPAIVPAAALCADGHPAHGAFLPPLPFPRRMWASSQVTFHDALLIGDRMERTSVIRDIALKDGRSGPLCFVSLEHTTSTARGPALTELQDIVFRPAQGGAPTAPAQICTDIATWQRPMRVDTAMLFRYSAISFNAHRIHYDRPYAVDVEGYPGLIVHGPIQATLLFEFATSIRGQPPARFALRGEHPLFDFEAFELCARETGDGALELWVRSSDQIRTMRATASW